MKFGRFLKDKAIASGIMLITFLFAGLLLVALGLNFAGVVFILLLCLMGYGAGLIFEFLQKRRFYSVLSATLKNLEQKTLIGEMLDEPEFQEGLLCYDALRESNKSMNDEISKYRNSAREYREYVELWMHEVKTPVATARLTIENHPTPEALSLGEEINKIDEYLEQALFYSRSNTVEKDYSVVSLELRPVINAVIKKNAKVFIGKGIHVDVQGEATVFSDEKWLLYMINQIVVNAIKYAAAEKPKVFITMETYENQALLRIADNGIGIPERDVERVFEKGFTGENGRIYGKSTGIGLYLCKKLADKLGLGIKLESSRGKGTMVTLVFPKGSFTEM